MVGKALSSIDELEKIEKLIYKQNKNNDNFVLIELTSKVVSLIRIATYSDEYTDDRVKKEFRSIVTPHINSIDGDLKEQVVSFLGG